MICTGPLPQDADDSIKKNALQMLKDEVKASTGSMTSVPKVIKFVGPHYDKLKVALFADPPSPDCF